MTQKREFEETPGLGFLRLHSTFRHDLKIYASDEGRVQMTAAAFTKGLLALEGELTPILVQMVKSANTNGLLDKQGETSKSQRVVKDRLMHIFNENRQLTEADYMKIAPTCDTSLKRALEFTKNPRKQCEHVHNMVKELTAQIRKLMIEHRTRDQVLPILLRRYSKGVSSPERFVRTRLYFTSESHIHSLLNMFKFGGLCDYNNDEQWKKAIDFISATEELNYMTQIVIMMFEDPTKEPTSDERFHIELHFSPGAYTSSDKSVERFPIGSGCRTLSFKQNSKNGQKDTLDVSSIKTLHSRVISAPSVIQEDAEEIDEAELFDHGIDSDDTTTKSPSAPHDFELPLKKLIIPPKLSTVPQTKSPDPDVPEWDWGDEPEIKSEDTTSSDKDNDQEQESGAIPVRESWSSPAATNFPMSPPIEIRSQGSKGDLQSSSYGEHSNNSAQVM
ncbi:hypothetical protein KUTeg_010905 [Tegillarca granosa]|uniref:Inositol hexakisphosphate and diphosphoinositol-pentakisphosphate kinase n=1 Tax=Tegillarca granosa TaxID=220873 RepID=A0ABQ9F7K1_TEGGR|nr:hypothetical protein KUTeg_010905 [Tegillarca granosa]